MKKSIVAMLLAGGMGSRLNILVRKRAKPALPFGSIYRLIDFTMSNVANSNIDVVGVLTQYKPLSLMEHIDNGRPWDLFGRTRLVEILPPKTGEEISDWYKGTSDAVYQNLGFIEDFSPELVLVVSGDHIYHMNYHELIVYHRSRKADATICLIKVPIEEAHHFGIARIDDEGRVIDWIEKPKEPKSNLASMGVYVFNKEILFQTLNQTAQQGGVDFAKDIMPVLLKNSRVFGFLFDEYWRDVGTIDSYWNTNMDVLDPNSGLNIKVWHVKTKLSVRGEIGDRPSAYLGRSTKISNSLIARGCVIEGQVLNSLISPGVRIRKNAQVIDSIIFHDTSVGENAIVRRCVCDKSVTVEASVVIGEGEKIPNKEYPNHLFSGITIIGKGAHIASGIKIGKNCIIKPDAQLDASWQKSIDSGSTI